VSALVVGLLLAAGLSESIGRVLPVVAGRSGVSRPGAIGLVLAGAVVEGALFALWPLVAWILATLVQPAAQPDGEIPGWTPGSLAVLLLAAVRAFPLLGPLLHTMLLTGAAVGLADALTAPTGLNWWAAAGYAAIAYAGLALVVAGVRRLVTRLHTGNPEAHS
jgi:hypothetical protein